MKRLTILMIRAYQVLVSPWLGNRCRFYPSCSAYCAEAIEEHGCLKGIAYGLRRIVKCHPFHSGGLDPVPRATHGAVGKPNGGIG